MPFLLYALVTWTTRDRGPLITVQAEAFLRKTLAQIAHRHGAAVLAMGIVDDHVHLLVRLPARFDVPRLAQGLKGTTARLANRDRIAEQATLCAVEERGLVGAAHLLRYGQGPEVSAGYRGAGEIAWLLFWPMISRTCE